MNGILHGHTLVVITTPDPDEILNAISSYKATNFVGAPPLVRYTYAGGIPIEKLISREQIDAIVDRTRRGGAEIVGYLKTGSAYYAPAAAVIQMAEAVLKDKKRILPVSAYLQGEYGENDIFAGTPAIIGGNGMERIIEVDLTADEKVALDKSFQSVRKVMAAVK
ncbi:hypothetical protein M1M90_03230 [Thermodesulfovibrionales bacterium]|nr:hypothetical protein [Thermodesulfovibrionales bacterium]